MFTISKPAPWMERAKCAEIGHCDLWFPAKDDGSTIRMAKKLCNECPVRTLCLEHALSNNEEHGVWGGKTAAERARMRRDGAA